MDCFNFQTPAHTYNTGRPVGWFLLFTLIWITGSTESDPATKSHGRSTIYLQRKVLMFGWTHRAAQVNKRSAEPTLMAASHSPFHYMASSILWPSLFHVFFLLWEMPSSHPHRKQVSFATLLLSTLLVARQTKVLRTWMKLSCSPGQAKTGFRKMASIMFFYMVDQ